MPPTYSPVPLLSFCSVCCLHRPNHRQPITTSPASVSAQGEGRAATSSSSGRCHRNTSPPHRQRPAATGHRLDVLPSCPPLPRPRPFLVLFLQVVRTGQRVIQGGEIHCRSSCRPSPPCRGVPGHKAVKFCLSSENQGHCRAAVALFRGRECLQNLFLSLSNHYPKNEAVKSKTEKIQIRIK